MFHEHLCFNIMISIYLGISYFSTQFLVLGLVVKLVKIVHWLVGETTPMSIHQGLRDYTTL